MKNVKLRNERKIKIPALISYLSSPTVQLSGLKAGIWGKRKSLTAIFATILILNASPSEASTQSNGNNSSTNQERVRLIEEIFGEQIDSGADLVKDYVSDFNNFRFGDRAGSLLDIYFSVLNSQILNSIQSGLSELYGALGFPNSEKISEKIPEIIINDETEEVAEFTLLNKKKAAINSSQRMLTEAHLQSRLGEEAQEQKKAQLENISQVAFHAVEAAEEAANLNVTQDVLKQVAVQNADAVLINRSIYGELTQLGMNQTMTNHQLHQMLNNLSDEKWQETVNSAVGRVSLANEITSFTSLF